MPVLGMKGTGGFSTPDERPKNYRELINMGPSLL